MNICMVLDAHDYDRNTRLPGEAQRLISDGHHVVVVCDHASGKELHEVRNGVEIVRLPRGSPIARLWYWIAGRLGLVLFLFEPRWFVALSKLHRERQFDVFHVHDLPMARTVMVLARLVQRPVVLDLHENYPVLMQSFVPESWLAEERGRRRLVPDLRLLGQGLKEKIHEWTLDPGRWARYEGRAVSAADRVIVVVEEAQDRIAGLGVPEDRITVVSNSLTDEFVSRMSSLTDVPDFASVYSDRFVIPYFGSLPRFVRIDTLIRAMPDILNAVPNGHLLIVGDIESRPECQSLAGDLDLNGRVTFVSWQPVERYVAYLKVSDIGILPFEPDGHTNATIPWKLFQYMFAQLPIIASECAPLKRIISGCRCGVVVPGLATDPAKLATAVIRLARDPAERMAMGKRGRETVLSKYRWAADGDRLAGLYRSLRSGDRDSSGARPAAPPPRD